VVQPCAWSRVAARELTLTRRQSRGATTGIEPPTSMRVPPLLGSRAKGSATGPKPCGSTGAYLCGVTEPREPP
jgi:hypothetical protein